MEAYLEWYVKEYNKVIGVDAVNKAISKPWFKKAMKTVPGLQYLQNIFRHEILETIATEVLLRRTEYFTTVFRIYRKYPGKSKDVSGKSEEVTFNTIYAYLYTYWDGKKFNHEFYCFGPTFRSCDGEYRGNFLPFRQLKWNKEQFKESFGMVEHKLLGDMKSTVDLSYTIFPPKDAPIELTKKLNSIIDRQRLAITLYIPGFLIFIHDEMLKIQANHILSGYRESMFGKDYAALYKSIVDKMGEKNYILMLSKIGAVLKSPEIGTTDITLLGQKFIPLKAGDLEYFEDLSYSPWREYFITSLVGDLPINGISPSFPIIAGYFFINTNSPELFDNSVTKVKLKHSKVAEDIVKELEVARTHTYLNPKKQDVFISYRMEGLSDHIEIPIEYAEKELIMSNYTMCIVIEHIGRTFADVFALNNLDLWNFETGPIFEDFWTFSAYMFGYLYALASMNSKIGIIHGDLHLNNVTIFRVMSLFRALGEHRWAPNNYMTYLVNDKVYMFPFYGRYAGIIDFSRSFVTPELIHQKYPNKIQAEQQIDKQRRRMSDAFKREMPEFYKEHGVQFEILMLRNPDLSFRILTALDSHRLFRGIAQKMEENKIGGKFLSLVRDIQNEARYYLRDVVVQAAQGQITEIGYPNEMMLEKFFRDFQVTKVKPKEPFAIADVFNYDQPIKYNIRDYEAFPETAKWDEVLKRKIQLDVVRHKRFQKLIGYFDKEEDRTANLVEDFQKEKGKRRGNPKLSEDASAETHSVCDPLQDNNSSS